MADESELLYTLARRQRAGADATYLRDLTASDLESLRQTPEASEPPVVQRLRHSHHLIARLVAEGRRPLEVASITGYSPSRINMLQGDPAFRDLIAYYSEQVEAKYLSVHDKLAALGTDIIEELHERFDNDPDSFTKREMMDLAELTLDRSVAPVKGANGKGFMPGGGAPAITIQFVEPKAPITVAIDQPPTLELEEKPK